MYVCPYVCVYTCRMFNAHVHVYNDTYVHTYTHTYIRTDTNTYMPTIPTRIFRDIESKSRAAVLLLKACSKSADVCWSCETMQLQSLV